MGIKGPETSEGNLFHLPYIITCGFHREGYRRQGSGCDVLLLGLGAMLL